MLALQKQRSQQQHHSSAPDLNRAGVGEDDNDDDNDDQNHPSHPSSGATGAGAGAGGNKGTKLRPYLTQSNLVGGAGGLSKAGGSSKKLSFNLSNTSVADTYSKADYNRKPPPNMTFQRLDNKLRTEIREELNTFKRHEMRVHRESSQNTVFH